MATILTASVVTGCNINSDSNMLVNVAELKENQVLRVDENICGTDEASIIIMDMANQYKIDLGGDIGKDFKIGDKSFTNYVKDKAKSDISIVYAISALADKNNIELTEEETDKLGQAAKEYVSGLTDAEKKFVNASEETVKRIYTNYYKADKYFDEKTASVIEEVSDEDARAIRIQYIYMSTDSEEKPAETLKQVRKQVENGYQDFVVQANKYTEAESVEICLYKNLATQQWEKAAFELQDGQMTKVVKQDDGYYLVKCISAYEKDETTKNKANIVASNKSNIVKTEYDEYIEKATKDINSDAWNNIKVPMESDIKSTNLFEVYDSYMKNQ